MASGSVYEQTAFLMLDAARQSKPLAPLLEKHCPWVASQLRQTAKFPELLGFWGKSLNFDEHANAAIVEPPILKLIGELAGQPMRGRILHAGLMHSFGYLFSLIETPFGKKRDRWVQPELEQGLGLASPTLRDRPSAGTLLLNLTYFLGRIAFRDRNVLLKRLQANSSGVAPAAREYPYPELKIQRLVERATIAQGRRKGSPVEIHTDFVTLPHPPKQAGTANTLLVYSVVNGARLGHQLITAFTVAAEFVRETLAPTNLGRRVEIRTRYNTYVEGLTGQIHKGRRFVEP